MINKCSLDGPRADVVFVFRCFLLCCFGVVIIRRENCMILYEVVYGTEGLDMSKRVNQTLVII